MFFSCISIGLVLPVFADSQFINRLTVEECELCCTTASGEFQAVNFNVGSCTAGCRRDVGSNQLCSELFDEDVSDPERLGCEIGRDFLSTGVTPFLEPGQVVQCDRFANLAIVNLIVPNAADFVVDANDCDSCCSTANSNFDNNGDDPDDFGLASCQETCETPDFCFDEAGHRERTGCLVALDFLSQGLTTLSEEIVACDNEGNVADFPLTDFPTASPSVLTPESEEDIVVIVIVGVSVGILLISIIVCIWARNELKKMDKQRSILEGTPGSHIATSLSEIHSGSVVIQIEIPASEASKQDFNISNYLPTYMSKASTRSNRRSSAVPSPRRPTADDQPAEDTHPRYHLSLSSTETKQSESTRQQQPSTGLYGKSWHDGVSRMSELTDRPPTF